ncbi:MAG: CDP-alcohol phosphatidyltransferase family protein [Ignavibacteriae bacterium]|nr:CDP-alcohol phosphatidyltransferase family protein [Ignavibacteriota bacterium]
MSNFLSFLRVLLVPPVAYCIAVEFPYSRLWAAGLIVVAIISDVLDGYLARKLHQVSELGKVIDPLADKIAAITVTLVLAWTGDMPVWFVALVVLRDVLILFGGIYIQKKKNIVVQSNWLGKLAVAVLTLYVFLTVLSMESLEGIRQVTMVFCSVLLVASFVVYVQRIFVGRKVSA